IEGNTLSLGETELALRGITVRGKNITEVLEAQNHPEAIELIKKIAFDPKYDIKENDIKNIHRIIMNGIISSAGKYRKVEVNIIGAVFSPPLFYDIPQHMKELMHVINKNPDELRPIELAAYVHHSLSWIHPFDDGNGRIARILLNLVLLRNGYRFVIIRKVDRKKYLESLRKADSGEPEQFVTFIARCVEQTIDIYLLELENEKEGKKNRKATKQNDRKLIEKHRKLFTLKELAENTPYSSEYLSLLARKGVLDAIKVGKIWKTTEKVIDDYVNQHNKKIEKKTR
ncbi:MAG: Fic family protein, partial [Nitrososphaeraceae archaeon]